MAFLDNSGDIILDAVLTDTGRARLAKGDGSFRITKFAVGDDEINYGLYDKNNPSGSAYYDLEILQTPVLEAFTNNASSMKSKLISISRTNLLYLPVVELNQVFAQSTKMHTSGAFFVAVDKDTEDAVRINSSNQVVDGIILGQTLAGGSYVRADQGLDTNEIPPSRPLDSDLVETQYIVEMDNRLGFLASVTGFRNAEVGTQAKVSYIDDDNIASYYFSLGTDLDYVQENTNTNVDSTQSIAGPRGTFIKFRVGASIDLNTSTYLFDQLGSTSTMNGASGATAVKFIDSIIRITGATTGYSIDIPVRYIKV